MAQQYHRAATTLLGRDDAESPFYFLYTHTIELALKAYLRSHSSRIPRGHDLRSLIRTCQRLGLQASLDLQMSLNYLNPKTASTGFDTSSSSARANRRLPTFGQVVDEVSQRRSNEPNAAVIKFRIGKPEKKR